MTDATAPADSVETALLRDRAAEVRGREALGVIRRIGPAMAVLLLVFAVFDVVGHPDDQRAWRLLTDLVPAAVLGAIVLAERRGRITGAAAGWFVVLGSLVVSASVLVTAVLSGQTPYLGYLVVMTVVNGACALDVRQFAVSQTVPVVGTAVLIAVPGTVPSDLVADWMAVLVVALCAAVAVHLARARGFDEMARVLDLVEREAVLDPLTGLGTRRAFLQMSGVVIGAAEVSGLDLFVVFVDVDGLKAVNDGHGHDLGDQVLLTVARAMRECARSRDVLVRWGGDEFAVLGVGDDAAAERWRTSLLQRVAALNPFPGVWAGVVSVGVASSPPGAVAPADLVVAADSHMYEARRAARGG